ncbi:MAG: sulfotransferase domain-containing protein [Candidatus Shapirobacteria bacterium]
MKNIVVVSGLPRSGTSLMMAMLKAGGLPVLTDKIRKADEDNPQGYWELEKVKELKKDHSWLPLAEKKAVKMVSVFLELLPDDYHYQVIFMGREMTEILASQKQMLVRRGEKSETSDKQMAAAFQKHLAQIKAWLKKQPNFTVLYLNYNQIVKNPSLAAKKINHFLNQNLDIDKMKTVVNPKLYRQRK